MQVYITFLHSRDMFEGYRWNECPRYFTPMVILKDGTNIYIGDIV